MPTTEQVTIKCGETVDPAWTVLRADGYIGPVADEIVQDAVVRRLNTKRGTFWSDPDYGLLVSDYLLEGVDVAGLERIAIEVQQEILKEERIQAVTVTPKTTTKPPLYTIDLDVAITTDTNSEMQFTLRVDKVSTAVLSPGANV